MPYVSSVHILLSIFHYSITVSILKKWNDFIMGIFRISGNVKVTLETPNSFKSKQESTKATPICLSRTLDIGTFENKCAEKPSTLVSSIPEHSESGKWIPDLWIPDLWIPDLWIWGMVELYILYLLNFQIISLEWLWKHSQFWNKYGKSGFQTIPTRILEKTCQQCSTKTLTNCRYKGEIESELSADRRNAFRKSEGT